MRRGRGNEIIFPETQNMMPRFKGEPGTVITNITGGGSDIVHALVGYTYENPNFLDTIVGDPGNSEGGFGQYWQFIVPISTQIDQVSWRIPSTGTVPSASGPPISFAIYSMNDSFTEFNIVEQTDKLSPVGMTVNRNYTQSLRSRILIPAGIYALAYLAPCFNLLCIRFNRIVYDAINQEYIDNGWLPRYYNFGVSNPSDDFPAQINAGNITPPLYPFFDPPFTYWSDSQEFSV